MKHTIVLLLFLATAAWAQPIDLSGEWRISTDDQPAYAQPDFDDQSWKLVRMPWESMPQDGVYWVRRTFELPAGEVPAGFDLSRLTISLGPVAEVECEVDTGLPLGLVPDVVYAESTFTLTRGSSITFLSEGVVEAENSQRELFGFERTREISGKPAVEIAAAARAWGQNDDITVVTVRRTAS